MKIELIERNYDIGKRLERLITEKLEKLDRYFEEDAIARVVCSLQNKTYKMELTVICKKLIYQPKRQIRRYQFYTIKKLRYADTNQYFYRTVEYFGIQR